MCLFQVFFSPCRTPHGARPIFEEFDTMTPFLRNFLAGLAGAATLLIAACGGGDGGSGANSTPAAPAPTAVASANPSRALIGTVIMLDGSASTAPTGTSLSYQWRLATRPDGSTAVLSDASQAQPSFTPDLVGVYEAELTVSTGQASAVARVLVTATTDTPIAHIANANQSVLLGAVVTLDGSASMAPSDLPASDLRYQWRLTAQPTGEPATILLDTNSAKARFSAVKKGIYQASLVVQHGDKTSTPAHAEIRVNTGNSAPVAKARAATTVVRGQTVVLDGSDSFDPDGDPLHYRWSFPLYNVNQGASLSYMTPPRSSTAVIQNAHSAKAEFTPDAAGRYDVFLTVYDASVSHQTQITIEVSQPKDTPNTPPVAVIGNGAASHECELGAYCGISSSLSHDADNDPLSLQWTYWNITSPNNKHTATGRGLYAIPTTTAGTWQVELIANDGQANSPVVTQIVIVKTGANVAPSAVVSVDSSTVMVGQTIHFDGSASTDPNGDPLSFEWALIDRPDGSKAVLQNPSSARASVVADQPGIYKAQVIVTDPKGATGTLGSNNFATVFSKSTNNPPVLSNFSAAYMGPDSADQPLVLYRYWDAHSGERLGVPVNFSALLFDPDLDAPLYHVLTATRFPPGSNFNTSVAGQTAPLFTGGFVSIGPLHLSQPGAYAFELLASDGLASSNTATSQFHLSERENYPGLLLECSNRQRFWPYQDADLEVVLSPGDDDDDDDNEHYPRTLGFCGEFGLYAGDADYTVTDLVTRSTVTGVQPSFNGLHNGQVIRKGETVQFTVTRPVIADEIALASNLDSLAGEFGYDSDEYRNEEARLEKLYHSYAFTASFRIAEKPGRTFYIGPAQ